MPHKMYFSMAPERREGHSFGSESPGVITCLGYCNKIAKTEWLINNRNFFLTVLEARNSKIKVLVDSVSGEDLLLIVFSHGGRGKGALCCVL